jgi:hypothetical protein
VNATLKRAFELCVAHRITITAVWKPRDLLKLEDLLSRQADSSDWGLNDGLVQKICGKFNVLPKLDLFASDSWHVVDKFVSQVYMPCCTGAQALALNWRTLLPFGKFAWIFPPVRHIAEVVQMIELFKTNCVLIVPEQKATNWWISLHRWPLAHSPQVFEIARGTHACSPSRRVPVNTANPGLFKLWAIRIEW